MGIDVFYAAEERFAQTGVLFYMDKNLTPYLALVGTERLLVTCVKR